jgi:hypothetical protein
MDVSSSSAGTRYSNVSVQGATPRPLTIAKCRWESDASSKIWKEEKNMYEKDDELQKRQTKTVAKK